MNPLDPNTLEQLASIICDTDGPHHRQYWQLENFFTNAGWFGVGTDQLDRLFVTRGICLSRSPSQILHPVRRQPVRMLRAVRAPRQPGPDWERFDHSGSLITVLCWRNASPRL